VTRARKKAAEIEILQGVELQNPAQDNISVSRKDTHKAYGKIARALAAGDVKDKIVAVNVIELVRSMPVPLTKHQELVKRLQNGMRQIHRQGAIERGQGRD
jgi:hypothetical protein